MTLRDHVHGVIAACKKATPTPAEKMLVMSKLMALQAEMSVDSLEVPPDVFDGLDNESRVLFLHSFNTMMIMALSEK